MEETKQPNKPSLPGDRAHPSEWSQQFVNAMAHLYRGELSRIMVWRQRLDATTTWAIGTTTTLIGFSFSFPNTPHLLLLVNMVMCWILLWIEARRYRFYDAFRGRVRILEAHFYVPLLKPGASMLEGGWRDLLCEDLLIPSYKISALEAVGRRLKRNYIWLFGVVLVSWITKVCIHPPEPVDSLRTLYRAFGFGSLPAWVVLLVVGGFYLFLICLLISTLRKGTEEVARPTLHQKRWKI